MAAEPTEKRARAFEVVLGAVRARANNGRGHSIIQIGDARVLVEPGLLVDCLMLVVLNGFAIGVGTDIRFVAKCDEGNIVEVQPHRPWKSDGPARFQCPPSASATMRAILDICTQDLKWMREHHGKTIRPAQKVLADIRSFMRHVEANR